MVPEEVALGALLLARSGGDERDRKRSPSEKKTRVPVAAIATSGVSQMLAMAFANEALRFVSFPTQVLGKSCKMIPVMIGGVVAGRKYRASQYAQVAVVTAGVVAFNLGKPRRDARRRLRAWVGQAVDWFRARRLYDPELLAFVDLDAELLLRLHREDMRVTRSSATNRPPTGLTSVTNHA